MNLPKPVKRPKPKPKPIRRYKRPAYLRVRGGRGKLRKLADDAMSLYVRCRGYWRCAKCGGGKNIQNCHIIPKGPYPSGRYMEENALACCSGCHRFFTERPMEWREFVGVARHDGLHRLISLGTIKWDYAEQARRFLMLVARDYPHASERLQELQKQAVALEIWD